MVGNDVVLFGDTDAAGIGHYIAMLRYVEHGEHLFMDSLQQALPQLMEGPYAYPRVHLGVDYKAPVYFGDKLTLFAAVQRVGRASYTLQIEIHNETRSNQTLSATLVVAVVAKDSGSPVPIPPALRESLTQQFGK